MRDLRYNPECKQCRLINFITTCIGEGVVGFMIGKADLSLFKAILLFLFAQYILFIVTKIANKVQPMMHHMFEEE